MQNQSDMEDIEIEPKDRCDDKTMKSVISEIGKKKVRYPCNKCH